MDVLKMNVYSEKVSKSLHFLKHAGNRPVIVDGYGLVMNSIFERELCQYKQTQLWDL